MDFKGRPGVTQTGSCAEVFLSFMSGGIFCRVVRTRQAEDQQEADMQTEFPTQPSYRTQREQFLAAATDAGATLTEYPHPLQGPFGESLSTDVAVLGEPGAKRLLIALSGTHGVEGFYAVSYTHLTLPTICSV